MWAISKWPILMRPPRVITKLMVSEMISLCQLITLLHVGSACDYCLAGISSGTSCITTKATSEKRGLPFLLALGFVRPQLLPKHSAELMLTLALQLPSRGQQQPASCLTLLPNLLLNRSSKCLGMAAGAGSQTPHFTQHLSPKKRINAETSKVEFVSSNIFPCTDHYLLWCLTHTTQHWYVPSMRIIYSEYARPIFLTAIPSLIKKKEGKNVGSDSDAISKGRSLDVCSP